MIPSLEMLVLIHTCSIFAVVYLLRTVSPKLVLISYKGYHGINSGVIWLRLIYEFVLKLRETLLS